MEYNKYNNSKDFFKIIHDIFIMYVCVTEMVTILMHVFKNSLKSHLKAIILEKGG